MPSPLQLARSVSTIADILLHLSKLESFTYLEMAHFLTAIMRQNHYALQTVVRYCIPCALSEQLAGQLDILVAVSKEDVESQGCTCLSTFVRSTRCLGWMERHHPDSTCLAPVA